MSLTLLLALSCLSGAIRVITGKPGGGKSFFALKDVIEELVFGCRVVVTNLPIKLPELNAFIQKRYPKADVDLHDRVRLLSDEETTHFYAHRAHGVDFYVPNPEETKAGKRVEYGDISKLRPVFYVIDEAHVKFDARAWMTSGPHLTYYNSQHRKPGDEVFFVTQFVALLDKRCTGFAQEFIECRNFGMERLSVFRGPKGQHQARYTLTPPNGTQVPAVHQALFRLDKEIADCYDTTSGVGISGRSGAPREKQIKGLNPVWGIAAAFALIAAIWYAPDLLTGILLKGADKVAKVGDAAGGRAVASMAKGARSAVRPSAAATAAGTLTGGPEALKTQPSEEKPALRGYWVETNAGRVTVHAVLSDGREIPPGEIQQWDFRLKGFEWVRWRGDRVEMETPAQRSQRAAREAQPKPIERPMRET